MSDVINGLKPEGIWQRFYEITQIPHPSKKEEKIRKYLKDFATDNKLQFVEDETGNIIMYVPATAGLENAQTVVLQGHIDMVCEKNKGTEHDFDNDPLDVYVDGEWFTARGTTLGADNGIGVAAALAIVNDETVEHGPLELLFTVDEETGMTGVNGLSSDLLKGRVLLNMDSEEDGVFYIGCSGGQDTVGHLTIEREDVKNGYLPYSIMITGLKGGHSGLDIRNGRANAMQILGRFLDKLSDIDFQIAELSGGSLRNAIPREAETVIYIDPNNENRIMKIAKDFIPEMLLEYKKNDGGLKVLFNKTETTKKPFTKDLSKRIKNLLINMPHGVLSMSPDIEGLVETSTNFATISEDNEKLRIGTSQRSAIDTAKAFATRRVQVALELAGAETTIGDSYPGWQPNMESQLLKTAVSVYKEMFGEEPGIKAIHAGLETGLLGAKYPGMDMISYGPTIEGAHSPDERLYIPAVDKFYNLTKGILKSLAK